MYIDYQQGDQKKWLALAEFVCNNTPSATTKISPFFVTKGYYPQISFDLKPKSKEPRNLKDREARRQAEQLALKLKATQEFMQDQIRLAQT